MVATNIVRMHVSKSILDALFLLVDDVPHFLEEISYNISCIAVALFELLLVSLIFLKHLLQSLPVPLDLHHLAFPLRLYAFI